MGNHGNLDETPIMAPRMNLKSFINRYSYTKERPPYITSERWSAMLKWWENNKHLPIPGWQPKDEDYSPRPYNCNW